MVRSETSSKAAREAREEPTTRDLLIESAIDCLAEFGFAGTTMRQVADRAGVTQGPRQYYFPSPIDLFAAVVDRIHRGQERFVSGAIKALEKEPLEARLRAVLEPAFEHCGNRRHVAMIELKLACRGHRDLREAIGEKIDRFEGEADRDWIRLLGSSGLPEERLIRMRTILSSTLRGLGVSIAAGSEHADRMALCEDMVSQFAWQLGRNDESGS